MPGDWFGFLRFSISQSLTWELPRGAKGDDGRGRCRYHDVTRATFAKGSTIVTLSPGPAL